jgi:ferric-dicitrate binding protein FerR (iron transport regulator)
MKNQDNKNDQHKPVGDEGLLQTLFKHTEAREKPSAENELAARKALHAEWRQIVARRNRRRVWAALAVAASVLIVVGAVIRLAGGPVSPGPAVQLAVVENQVGTPLIYPNDESNRAEQLRIGDMLIKRQEVETRTGSATALRWIHGQSIRLDENTRIRLDSADSIWLYSGRIYVDTTRRSSGAEALTIFTLGAQVRHVGTQYMAAVSAEGTTVSVRSGKVALDLSGSEYLVARGEQLTVTGTGKHRLQQIETWGELWQWTESVTPDFDSDGRTVAELIEWVATETGHSVDYVSFDAENRARQTILKGKLEREPMKALAMITQTSDMDAQVSDGLIEVSLANDG